MYTRYYVSSKSLEGDCCMDTVQQGRLLTPFQEDPHQKLFSQEKLCKHGGKLDCSRYSQVSLLALCYHWQILCGLEKKVNVRSSRFRRGSPIACWVMGIAALVFIRNGDCQRSLSLSAILSVLCYN